MKRRYAVRNVARALDIEELRHMALRRLPGFVVEYLEGGAEDEKTLLRNRNAFDELRFARRILIDVGTRSTATMLLGAPAALPIAISPTGFNGLLWKHGDIALARVAKQFGVPFTASIVASDSLEAIAKQAGGRLWMMLLVLRDPKVVDRLIERAEAAGYEALVLTLDAPVLGNRTWDNRNFAKPLKLTWRAKFDVLAHLRWLFGVFLPSGLPGFGNLAELLPAGQTSPLDGSRFLTAQSNSSLTWEGVKLLRDRWKQKLVLKGVMTAADAELAVKVGADAVILSNHGGRQLDSELAPIDVLEEVVAAVGPRIEILIDGGFRRGTDIAKALALGARGVMLGRSTLYGLAAGGEAGAARAVELLKIELDRTLALLGCPSVEALTPDRVRRH
jgi:(S)-mandelate dehydrogenase